MLSLPQLLRFLLLSIYVSALVPLTTFQPISSPNTTLTDNTTQPGPWDPRCFPPTTFVSRPPLTWSACASTFALLDASIAAHPEPQTWSPSAPPEQRQWHASDGSNCEIFIAAESEAQEQRFSFAAIKRLGLAVVNACSDDPGRETEGKKGGAVAIAKGWVVAVYTVGQGGVGNANETRVSDFTIKANDSDSDNLNESLPILPLYNLTQPGPEHIACWADPEDYPLVTYNTCEQTISLLDIDILLHPGPQTWGGDTGIQQKVYHSFWGPGCSIGVFPNRSPMIPPQYWYVKIFISESSFSL